MVDSGDMTENVPALPNVSAPWRAPTTVVSQSSSPRTGRIYGDRMVPELSEDTGDRWGLLGDDPRSRVVDAPGANDSGRDLARGTSIATLRAPCTIALTVPFNERAAPRARPGMAPVRWDGRGGLGRGGARKPSQWAA